MGRTCSRLGRACAKRPSLAHCATHCKASAERAFSRQTSCKEPTTTMRRFFLRLPFLSLGLLFAALGSACCDHSAFDMTLDVPPADQDKECNELCGAVLLNY